jgi:regulatory protein
VTAITKIERLPDESVHVHTSAGSFLLRARYLDEEICLQESQKSASWLCEGSLLSVEKTARLIFAASAYRAEKKARALLLRSEQCEFLLGQKLRKKKFEERACKMALEYLREKNLLDDSRYARAWLCERAGKKAEGRKRLESELSHRGIAREIIQNELDAFFDERDEEALCRAAFEKALRLKKSLPKIPRYLLSQGFSFGQIRRVMDSGEGALGKY